MKLFAIILLALCACLFLSPVVVAATLDGSAAEETINPVSVGLVSVAAVGGLTFADTLVKMVKRGGQTADVNEKEVDNYRQGGWVLESEKNWSDGTPKDDNTDEIGDLIKAVGKMKVNELKDFVAERGLPIDLDDFSNQDERKAAVIAVLEAEGDE